MQFERFEWDENKRQINIEKHGIDFADAVKIFDGFTHDTQDTREDCGEERFVKEREIYYEEAKKCGYRLGET